MEREGLQPSPFETLSAHSQGNIQTDLDWPKPRQKVVSAPDGTDTGTTRRLNLVAQPFLTISFGRDQAHRIGVVDKLRLGHANLGCEDRAANITGSTGSQLAGWMLHASLHAIFRCYGTA